MSWTCKACQTCNWENRVTCRTCSAVQWPSPTAAAKKTKGKKQTITVTATSTQPSLTMAAAEEVPIGPAGTATVAQLKAEIDGLKASLAALGPKTSLGSAATNVARESLEAGIKDIEARIRRIQDRRTPLERLEGLRGAIGRGRRRLTEMQTEKSALEEKIAAEEALLAGRVAEVEELESNLLRGISKDRLGFQMEDQATVPPWLAGVLEEFAALVERGAITDAKSMAASLRGLSVPPPRPMPPEQISYATEADSSMGITPTPIHDTWNDIDQGSDSDLDEPTPVPAAQVTRPQAVAPSEKVRLNGKHLVETPQMGQAGSSMASGA